jgi:hypothetical protein
MSLDDDEGRREKKENLMSEKMLPFYTPTL